MDRSRTIPRAWSSLTQGIPGGKLFVAHTVSRERNKQLLSTPHTEQMVLMK